MVLHAPPVYDELQAVCQRGKDQACTGGQRATRGQRIISGFHRMDEDLGERPRGKIHRVKSDKNSLLDENRLTRQKTPPQAVLRLRGRLNLWSVLDCAGGGQGLCSPRTDCHVEPRPVPPVKDESRADLTPSAPNIIARSSSSNVTSCLGSSFSATIGSIQQAGGFVSSPAQA